MACTNILFYFLGKGDIVYCIVVSAINGFPFGAKFLADAILADIIDFDEFLTGTRSEATFTMFKSFLPKICAIPAAAVPIALLNAFGHVPPVNGRPQLQPELLRVYIKVVIVIIPTGLSVLAFLLKFRFPIKRKAQMNHIYKGIGQHLLPVPQPGIDPISGRRHMLLVLKTAEERRLLNLLNSFNDLWVLEEMQKDSPGTCKKLRRLQLLYWGLCTFMMAGFLTATYFTWDLLFNDAWSFIPVIEIICFGICLTLSLFYWLRFLAARNLVRTPPSLELVKLVTLHRTALSYLGKVPQKNMPPDDISFYDRGLDPDTSTKTDLLARPSQPQLSPQASEDIARQDSSASLLRVQSGPPSPGARPPTPGPLLSQVGKPLSDSTSSLKL